MSGIPSGISVLCHIPQHLVEGFISGEFRLDGGVMRRAAGAGQGQIVGILIEGKDLVRQVQQGLPIDTQALQAAIGNAQMASQLSLGIGVLNLGVQVAGFAMVLHRLDRIAGQIKAVRGELQAIGQNVEWLAIEQMASLRADAANAIATAERAERQGDRNLLNHAKTLGDQVRRHLLNLCDQMLVTGRAIPQRSLFEELMKMGVLVAYAESRCDEAVEGSKQAALDLTASVTQFRKLSDSFRSRISSFESNPFELIRIGNVGRAEVKKLARRVDDLVSRLESYVPQLELQHALGLDAAEWRALTAPEAGSYITCITTDTEEHGDLLERATAHRHSARVQAMSSSTG
ncbi:hypothetical protein ACFOD4_04645 [Pseudoroseomonas globiformis]|uniref:Uncharacterized protein n=1 Tax=Teichococcus globiformis TaxID=2307229 RepID=A0ABV7FYF5_9PROT